MLGAAVDLLGDPTASRFTKIWFDCEEAAKCICVLRPTAAVFHCMRILEAGIRAFAARLSIPDPVTPAERNWGIILKAIKGKIEAAYPAPKRMPGSEGAFMESLYATLDAVKNPWRNETMHVEGVYTDAEARFIFLNTVAFIQKMATGFDEDGNDMIQRLADARRQLAQPYSYLTILRPVGDAGSYGNLVPFGALLRISILRRSIVAMCILSPSSSETVNGQRSHGICQSSDVLSRPLPYRGLHP